MNKTISVVIPIYNEVATLPELVRRLLDVLAGITYPYEVIFVNDGSTDGSSEYLENVCLEQPTIRLIQLSRNFGHQPALTAGIDHAVGDAVVLMDGDLQDRPEAIPHFIAEWEKGAQVTYAVRVSRQEQLVYRTAFKAFYWVQHRLSGIEQPVDAGIFSLLDRCVIDALKNMPERNRYFPGLRAYAGYRQVGIPVDRDARFAGTSRVSIPGLFKLAVDGIISFSYVPIRLVTAFGCLVALGSFGYALRVLHKKLVTGEAIIGWASTLTAILFLGGVQLITLGILGEYIGRIYEEVKNRPYYIVRTKTNFPS